MYKKLSVPAFLLLAFVSIPVIAGADTVAYAAGTNDFGTLDLNTGAFVQIAPEASSLNDIAVSPSATLYGLDANNLVTINRTTGALTTIGALPGAADSIAFSASGTLYLLTSPGGLYTVNPATAASTLIGNAPSLNTGSGASDLRFDTAAGVLFATSYGPNAQLFTLNTSTAAATLVGSTGSTNLALGSFLGGTFYALEATGGSNFEVVTVNPSTAAVGEVASTNSAYNFSLAPVPEPSSLMLLGCGLLPLGFIAYVSRNRLVN